MFFSFFLFFAYNVLCLKVSKAGSAQLAQDSKCARGDDPAHSTLVIGEVIMAGRGLCPLGQDIENSYYKLQI